MSHTESIAGEQISRAHRRRSRNGYGVLPPPSELKDLRSKGLTQQQIADEIFKTTGHRVTREAVAMAMRRAGISKAATRYSDMIPWSVHKDHEKSYILALLRSAARRKRGLGNSAQWEQRLDSWLKMLDDRGWVVDYNPDTQVGFYYVPRRDEDDGPERRWFDVIRRPPAE